MWVRYQVGQACLLCHEQKLLHHFRFTPTKPTFGGYQQTCIDCEKKRNAAKARDARLRKEYGITTKQYDELLRKQKNRCAVCKAECSSDRRLAVDHDHVSGQIRGLLCGKCNRAIGLMSDDIGRFTQAARYLHEAEMERQP